MSSSFTHPPVAVPMVVSSSSHSPASYSISCRIPCEEAKGSRRRRKEKTSTRLIPLIHESNELSSLSLPSCVMLNALFQRLEPLNMERSETNENAPVCSSNGEKKTRRRRYNRQFRRQDRQCPLRRLRNSTAVSRNHL